MDADPGERNNLIKSHPELANQMKADLEEWTSGAMYPERYDTSGFSSGTEKQEKAW